MLLPPLRSQGVGTQRVPSGHQSNQYSENNLVPWLRMDAEGSATFEAAWFCSAEITACEKKRD